MSNGEESGARQIVCVLNDGLEFNMMLEARYLDINICKDECRQYIEQRCLCRINSFLMAVWCNCFVISMSPL